MSGKLKHEYLERLFPSGSIVLNDNGEEEWLIIGHEQYVFMPRDDRADRRSPIDTLVYNLLTHQYEIWDWKTTRVDMKYIKKKPLSQRYTLQVNWYGIQFRWGWHLDYYPLCRVIYLNQGDITDTHEFHFRCNDELYSQSVRNMDIVDYGKENPEEVAEAWYQMVDGMSISSHTKNPYRYECRYCPHAPISERVVYKRDSEYGAMGSIREGSQQCSGKCMDLLNLACKKKFKKSFANFDDFIDFMGSAEARV